MWHMMPRDNWGQNRSKCEYGPKTNTNMKHSFFMEIKGLWDFFRAIFGKSNDERKNGF